LFHIRNAKGRRVLKRHYKINIYNKLTFLNVGSLLLADSFAVSFRESFWNLQNLAKKRAKMKFICNKFINHQIMDNKINFTIHNQIMLFYNPWSNQEMFAISLSSCSRYNANFKLDQSAFAIHDSPPHILRSVRMTTHRNIVDEPRPRSLMNFRLRWCFCFPGCKYSRGELVPSHGASRRRLGDKSSVIRCPKS
jgi:hypothetical protein